MTLAEYDKLYESAHEEALAAYGTNANPITAAAIDNAHTVGLQRVINAVREAELRAELHWAAWQTSDMNAEEVLRLIANEFQWKLPSGTNLIIWTGKWWLPI